MLEIKQHFKKNAVGGIRRHHNAGALQVQRFRRIENQKKYHSLWNSRMNR